MISFLSFHRETLKRNSRLPLYVIVLLIFCSIFYIFSGISGNLHGSKLNCIEISGKGQSKEGIGAIFRRNQLAFFLAETYGARISFPNIESEHGYQISDYFGTCPKPKQNCVLPQEQVVNNRCPRGDCVCHRQKLDPYVTHLAKNCRSILFMNDRTRTNEYSGCFKDTALGYLGSNEKVTKEYDAIHVRAGDLAGVQGGKGFSDMEASFLLKALCILSDRDIIIVTEGQPKLPVVEESCRERLVLASDTSLADAFRIFQHAKHVAVGSGSFSLLLMEIASPIRVITMWRTVYFYEWVNVEHWTVIAKFGSVFHFDSKEMMIDACIHGKDLMHRSFTNVDHFNWLKDRLVLEVPRRRWTNDTTFAT